jgi:YVTN family beta-propeller protein
MGGDIMRNGSRTAPARGFMALFAIMLAMGLGLMARPAAAAPFAYVANQLSENVSVIDTATNTVVATVTVGPLPRGVAVTPDGTHAYVADGAGAVSVIETATNTVVATVTVGVNPIAVAVTPDGKHVYVANGNFAGTTGTVSVIATATNTVVATIPVGAIPSAVAITPDGTHAYVTNRDSNNVSVIATVSNTVVATVPVGPSPQGVAITPDGKHVYVANFAGAGPGTVSVIATASNMVWGPRSRWGMAPLGSRSPRMGNASMSRVLTPPSR